MSFSYHNKKAKLTSKQIWKHSPLTVPRTRSPKKKGRKIIKFHKEDKISFGGSISLHTRKPPRSSQFHYKHISETVPPTSCKKTKHPPIFNHFKSQNKYPHTSNETKKRKEKDRQIQNQLAANPTSQIHQKTDFALLLPPND